MAKLLLVEADAPPSGLKAALTGAGHEVARAPSGSFALTMLERNQPDAIVSRASLGDMRGDELCAIVRSDPATSGIAFVLLADLGAAPARHAAAAGVDLLVGGEIPVPSVIVRIQRFLAERNGERAPLGAAAPAAERRPDPSRATIAAPAAVVAEPRANEEPCVVATRHREITAPREPAAFERWEVVPERRHEMAQGRHEVAEDRQEVAEDRHEVAEDRHEVLDGCEVAPEPQTVTLERPGAAAAVPEAPAPAAPPALSVQGSLAVMELADLLQALARARKTGRLHLALPEGEGMLVLDTGRVVDARYGGRSAEPAVALMIAHAETGGTFAFYPLPRAAVAAEPHTIHATVERLLLEVAAQIDESRVTAERAVAAPPASAERG